MKNILVHLVILIIYFKPLIQHFLKFLIDKYAPVAQLDRALGYGPGGSGFKS